MSNRRRGASETRPLPPKPSLDYERKKAKALLRQLRSGNPDAFARAGARHPALRTPAADNVTLADAQLVIAREYGFVSWPRLVQYFADVERQSGARGAYLLHDRQMYESTSRSLLVQHRHRNTNAGRAFAASVPRFYGLTIEAVLASDVTGDDARLAVAHQNGFVNWDLLMQAVDAQRARFADPWMTAQAPLRLAGRAIDAGDLDAFTRVVAGHPELLDRPNDIGLAMYTVVAVALAAEERGVPGARVITDWLASQGVDVDGALNERWFAPPPLSTERVRFLLERGADPDWTTPNGVSALDYALLRYWNGDAVDLMVRRAAPRPALWIAAGLGDVEGVRRFLDRDGKPTAAAYRNRPDFVAVGLRTPAAPAPDAMEILAEAFIVAMLNDRVAVLDYMIDRGFPVDYLGWDMPFVSFAVGNQRLRIVECLVRHGADLDLPGHHPDMSARGLARERFEQRPNDPTARRILELCGAGDPDQVIAERDARPAPEPQPAGVMQLALELAADDAARGGQIEISPDNLFIGMLRAAPDIIGMMRRAGVDVERLRAEIGTRVLSSEDRVQRTELPLDSAARDVLRVATDLARQRKHDVLTPFHLLRVLIDVETSLLRDLVIQGGSNVDLVRSQLDKLLQTI
jgi:hypothetical protein